MGVHDYVCFIGRGGQCLRRLTRVPAYAPEDERCPWLSDARDADAAGAADADAAGAYDEDPNWDTCNDLVAPPGEDALIVRLPGRLTRREILAMPLRAFAAYPLIRATHSGEWDFDGDSPPGYMDALHSAFDNSLGGACYAIWTSPAYPGEVLVNFEYGAYHAFVLGTVPPSEIPWPYLGEVYANRQRPLPATKREAVQGIIEGHDQDLWALDEAEGLAELPALSIGRPLRELWAAALARPAFSRAYRYRVVPPESSAERPESSAVRRAPVHVSLPCPEFAVKYFRWEESPSPRIAEIAFCPEVDPADLVPTGCLECGGARDTGSFMCPQHEPLLNSALIRQTTRKIQDTAARLRVAARLRAAIESGAAPPSLLTARFNLQGKDCQVALKLIEHRAI